jgi:hypothetical protein
MQPRPIFFGIYKAVLSPIQIELLLSTDQTSLQLVKLPLYIYSLPSLYTHSNRQINTTFKMQFTKAFLALALVAAPIFAAPTAVAEDGQLESRAVSALL